ncbi:MULTISPECIES: holo-ACP synthase [Bacillaceae]|uniref:Holo-[acyl-carrier-protein] synthase n=1 Tax=Evansella alkalicola TaxID=745819 RepID=A0ABS6K2A1_9BACI|nr:MULTISPECIES: holo-ACP synthase [Bacillaceae]MBU9723795.1 holo-ACP synthase [Bacillus alkalicola]
MIKGIGLDLIELERIESLSQRKQSFIKRILTEEERDKYSLLKGRRQVEYLAGRFAAKEAFAKALGTGIGKDLSFQDISIVNDLNGKPSIKYNNFLKEKIHLSITHTSTYAAAQVIIEEKS